MGDGKGGCMLLIEWYCYVSIRSGLNLWWAHLVTSNYWGGCDRIYNCSGGCDRIFNCWGGDVTGFTNLFPLF